MRSPYLDRLSNDKRQNLIKTLLNTQGDNCFICGKEIDLDVHRDHIDIDHIEPIKTGGKDEPNNFAVTHDSCNRQKQASDLRVAKVLSSFEEFAKARRASHHFARSFLG